MDNQVNDSLLSGSKIIESEFIDIFRIRFNFPSENITVHEQITEEKLLEKPLKEEVKIGLEMQRNGKEPKQ